MIGRGIARELGENAYESVYYQYRSVNNSDENKPSTNKVSPPVYLSIDSESREWTPVCILRD